METINIQELVDNTTEFEKQKSKLKDLILNDFSRKYDKCCIHIDGEDLEITKGQLLLNLFLLSLFKESKTKIVKDYLFLKESISGDDIQNYVDKVLTHVKKDGLDFNQFRQSIYEFLNHSNELVKLNVAAGNTIDFMDFIEIEERDPEASKLFSAPRLRKMQFSEMENAFHKKSKELEKYFDTHKETNLSVFTRSNTGINYKQATQCLAFVGLKPNFKGGVIPKPVKSNYLKGLDCIEDYYISSTGARMALSTNYTYVRKSGYFTRKLNLLMTDTWHDNNYVDCGTKHYVEYKVDSPKKLKLIDGRHYYDLHRGKPDYDNLKTIYTEDCQDLIGKTIALRSPVTCLGNKRGGHICATCYGRALSEINKNIHTGLVAVLLITNILTQRLLSAKHLLTTNTDNINWGENFLDAFSVEMDSVYFNEESNVEIQVPYPEEDDYDEDMLGYKLSHGIDIKFSDDKKVFHYDPPTTLYLNSENVPKKTEDTPFLKFQTDTYGTSKDIFKYIPHNNMLSKSLQNILDLIESSNHIGVTTYSELVNTFGDLLIENGMGSISSVHAEMICSKLIVDKKTGKPVDWSQNVIQPYTINRVSKSILSAPISVALSFERLGDQLSNLETYLKDDDSIMDSLFN